MTSRTKHPYQAKLTQTDYQDLSPLSKAEQQSNKAVVAKVGQRQEIILMNREYTYAQFMRKDSFENEIWRIDDEAFQGSPLAQKGDPIYVIRRPDLLEKFWLVSSEQLDLENTIPLNINADSQKKRSQYHRLEQLSFIGKNIPTQHLANLLDGLANIYDGGDLNDADIDQSDFQAVQAGLDLFVQDMTSVASSLDTLVHTYQEKRSPLNEYKQRYCRLRSLPESLAVYDVYDAVINHIQEYIQELDSLEKSLLDFKYEVANIAEYCAQQTQYLSHMSESDIKTFGQVRHLLAPVKKKLETFFAGHMQLYRDMHKDLGGSFPHIEEQNYEQALPVLNLYINNELQVKRIDYQNSEAQLLVWYKSLDDKATELENAIPCWFWSDTLMHVQSNRKFYDNTYGYKKNFSALPRQRVVLNQSERHAVPQDILTSLTQSGLAHFYKNSHGALRIVIPFHNQTGDTFKQNWAEFTVDTTTPIELWITAPEALQAIATGKPMVYPDTLTGQHRIIAYVPVRGLILLYADKSYVQAVASARQAYLDADDKQPITFTWNTKNYILGADIKGTNGTLEPTDYVLNHEYTDGNIQQYALLDAQTGESVAGEQSAEQGWVFKGLDTTDSTAYQTTQAYNASIKRTDSDTGVACVTDDGHMTNTLKFVYRNEIGAEIWVETGPYSAGFVFIRSLQEDKFLQTKFLNWPLSDAWVDKKTFYGVAQWSQVVEAIKKTPQTGLLIEWQDEHSNLYSSGIIPEISTTLGRSEHVLSYVEQLDKVVPLRYIDGNWFVVDTTTSRPVSDTPWQWNQEAMQFVTDSVVTEYYETITFASDSPWLSVAKAVLNASEKQQYVQWTASDGTVYTTKRRSDSYDLNAHRLVNVSGQPDLDVLQDDAGGITDSVVAVWNRGGKWFKVDPSTGQIVAGEAWLYDEVSDSLYRPTPTGQTIISHDESSTWQEVSQSVLQGQHIVEWTAPDGLVYSTERRAYFPRIRRLITVYETGKPKVYAVEYTGFQYACVIDTKTGESVAGLFVKNDDAGTYYTFINKVAAQAVIQSRSEQDEQQQELIMPARGAWLGRIAFTHQNTWQEIADAARQQKQTGKFVEWEGPDGEVYTSRRFKKTTNGHILTAVPESEEIFALKQIGEKDWVAINRRTGELDYRHVTVQDDTGALHPMVNMRQQMREVADFVMPNDGALGIDSPEGTPPNLDEKNRIITEYNKAKGSPDGQQHKFHTADYEYTIANILGVDTLTPARTGLQVVRTPYDDLGQVQGNYLLIDINSGLPVMQNNKEVSIVKGANDQFMTVMHFNQQVDKKQNIQHIATDSGDIFKVQFARQDDTGAEIWVRMEAGSDKPLLVEEKLSYLRRNADGTHFEPFVQSVVNQGFNTDIELKKIVTQPIDTGAELTSWNGVLKQIATYNKPMFKATVDGKEMVFHSDDDEGYDTRILKLQNHDQSEWVLGKRIFGHLWQEIDPNTLHYTGSLIRTDAQSGNYIRYTSPLESLWKQSFNPSYLNTPIDEQVFSREGSRRADIPFVRTYVSGMKFVPVASKPGHHDYLQGILQIANPIDTGVNVKTMFPVVTYGKESGLSQDRSFIRGFGGRLINPELLVYVYQNLDKPLVVDGDNSKTLRQHLESRYGHKLPVQNLVLMLSSGSQYYEKVGQTGQLPTVSHLDIYAPSLAEIHKTIASWGGYTNSDFSVPGIDKPSSSAVTSNRNSIYLTYNKAEQQLILYHGLRNRNAGASAQGEAGEFTNGPILSRLMGVKSIEVLSNPNLPGKRTVLDGLRRIFGTPNDERNVQLHIDEKYPIVLHVKLQDKSKHLIYIKEGAVRMVNLGVLFNPYAQILGTGTADDNFVNIDTYSYNGSYLGTDYTDTGTRNPILLLDNGDRVPVAPLLLPAPSETNKGHWQEGISYMARKLLLDGLLGIGTNRIAGSNSVSWVIDKALIVARKVLLIHYASKLRDSIVGDNEIRLGAFGDIDPQDSHFWGGITAMVMVQEVMTYMFKKIRENIPDVLSSRDRFITHYVLAALGYSAEQYMRLQTNFMLQKTAGFPRGDWDSSSDWGIPLLSSGLHGLLETLQTHNPKVDGIDLRNGALKMMQFLVDSISRGTLNALTTNDAEWTDVIGRAIMERMLVRSFDRAFLPGLQTIVQNRIDKNIGTSDPLIDQYRLTYAQENQAGDWTAKAKRSVARVDEGILKKWDDTTRTITWLPVQKIKSLWTSAMLFEPFVWHLVSYLAGASMQMSDYKKISEAILKRDLTYAQGTDSSYDALQADYENLKNSANDVDTKPHMNWDINLPPQFREWITHQKWRPNLFMVQAGPDFIQRLASAYAGEVQSGRVPQELGTFSTAFQVVIRDISLAMRGRATLEADLKKLQDAGKISAQTRNDIRRAINGYTVESNIFHYLLRYDQTGTTKNTDIVKGIGMKSQVMTDGKTSRGNPDHIITPISVLAANFLAQQVQKYGGILYRGVNTIVGYAPNTLSNPEAGEKMPDHIRQGDIITNTEMFSASQAEWLAQSFGTGIDQAQLRTDTRQKIVIIGKTSVNVTELSDLNQAEAIFTPGTVFQIDKIEGRTHGNDIGNVVYVKQINTFDWERNFYYLEKGMYDKIVQTPGQNLPIAMDPITGITYQFVTYEAEGGQTKHDKYFMPVKNYFLGWGIKQREGEVATWFRPFDSPSTPQGMRDGIYTAWVERDSFLQRHLEDAVKNVHHEHFRQEYRDIDAVELMDINQFRYEYTMQKKANADDAKLILNDPHMLEGETPISIKQQEKLLIWQMANVLRRKITLFALNRNGDGRFITQQTPEFVADTSYDGVSLSNVGDSTAYPAINIGFYEENGHKSYYINMNVNDVQPNTNVLSGTRWFKSDFETSNQNIPNGSRKFGSGAMESLVHAIHIGANGQGYGVSNPTVGNVFDTFDTVAGNRYGALVDKMRQLANFDYDLYQYALASFYDALIQDDTIDRVVTPKVLDEGTLPIQYQRKIFDQSVINTAKRPIPMTQKTAGTGDHVVNIDYVLQDEFNDLWLQTKGSQDLQYIPITLYEGFDYKSDAPNTLVFQNQDPKADVKQRFFIWDRSTQTVQSSAFVPPNAPTLKPVDHDPSGNLLIDANYNLFLSVDEKIVPVREMTGFRHLQDPTSKTYAFIDLSDTTGKSSYVWVQSVSTEDTWKQLRYVGNRPKTEFGNNVTYYEFMEHVSNTQVKVWQYRTDEQDGNRWRIKFMYAGEAPRIMGQDIVYTSTDNHGNEILKVAPIQKISDRTFIPVKASKSHRVIGQIEVNGLSISVQESQEYGKKLSFFIMMDNNIWHIDKIKDNGILEISSDDGSKQATLDTKNLNTIVQSQDFGNAFNNPKRHALLVKAEFDGKNTGRHLLEITPNTYMFVSVMSQSEQSNHIIALDEKTKKLIDFDRNTYQWTVCPTPTLSNGKYALHAYWIKGADSLSYWDPVTSGWKASFVDAQWQSGGYQFKTILNAQEFIVNNKKGTNSASLVWQGKPVVALDTSGVPFDTNNQMIWLDSDDEFYRLKQQGKNFAVTPLTNASLRDFVAEFYGVLGLKPNKDDPLVSRTIEKLKGKNITSVNDILQGNNLLHFLISLWYYSPNGNTLLYRITVRLHRPASIENIKLAHVPTKAALHIMEDSRGGLSYWHWGDKNFALQEGQYYSKPASLDEIPLITGHYYDEVDRLVDGYYNTTLLSDSVRPGNIWTLHMAGFTPILAAEIYESPDGSKKVWLPIPRNGALLIGDGSQITIAKRSPQNVIGMQKMVAIDLGSTLAYWSTENRQAKWALIPIQTHSDNKRTVKISYRTIEIASQGSGYNKEVTLELDGQPITDMDSFGDFRIKDQAEQMKQYNNFGETLSAARESVDFYIGTASGRGNNCLIHSIILATNDSVHSQYNADFVKDTANRIRKNMITEMQEMHILDPSVRVIGDTEQIDATDSHQMTALVKVLRQDRHVGSFQANDTLIIHARHGLEYQATLPEHTEDSRAIHLWYEGTGFDGHFSPILSTNRRYGFYTYYNDATDTYDRLPVYDSRLGPNSGILSALPTQTWDKPNIQDLTRLAQQGGDNSDFGYDRQYILQLNGDDAVYKSSYNLFSKHPKKTDWLQIRQGKIEDTFGWRNQTSDIGTVDTFPADGGKGIRVTLVGHTITNADGSRRFADLDLADVQKSLDALLSKFNKGDISSLRVSLLGCQLAQPQYKPTDTIPGKLAQWLMDKQGDYGIAKDKITITAREYPVRVNSAGKKEILTSDGRWIVKEDARLWDAIHKYVFAWDINSKSVIMKMPDVSIAHEIGVEVERALQDKTLTVSEKAHLAELHYQIISLVRQQLFDTPQPPAEHRNMVEKTTALLVGSIDQALTWLDKVKKLKQDNNLGANWLPLWNIPNANTPKIQFINKETGQSKLITANDPVFTEFSKNMEQKLKDFKKGVTYDRSKHKITPKDNISDADAVNTLNAAFFFQTILELSKGNNSQEMNYGELATVMKVQMYVQLTQDTFGIVEDMASLVNLVAEASKFNSRMFSRVLGVFGRVSMGINVALDVVNIVTSAVALHHSKTDAEKAVYGTQLGIAVISSGVSFGAMIAGFAGAATLSAVLGAVAVPLAGIGFAIPYLVGSLLENQQKFDQVVELFDRILDTVSNPGIHKKDGVSSITAGAAVAEIDFLKGEYKYAKVTTDSLTGGSNRTRCKTKGHYWYTYATNGPYTGDPIDVYEGFGVSETQSFNASEVDILVLPYESSSHYKLTYQAYSGDERREKPEALGKLHDHYEDRFQWGYYQACNYSLHNVQQQIHYQSLKVILDLQQRTLILPSVSNSTLRSHLHYRIHFSGGSQQIVLADKPSWVDMYNDSDGNPASVTIICDQALKKVTTKDKELHVGDFKNNIFKTIKYHNNVLTIGSQHITFNDTFKKIILEFTLDNSSAVRIQMVFDPLSAKWTTIAFIPFTKTGLNKCTNPFLNWFLADIWEGMRYSYVDDILIFANTLDSIPNSPFGTVDVVADLEKDKDRYTTVGQVKKKQTTTATGKDRFEILLTKITVPRDRFSCLWKYTWQGSIEGRLKITAQLVADWKALQSSVDGYVAGHGMVLAMEIDDTRYVDEVDDNDKPTGKVVLEETKSINFVHDKQSDTLIRYPMQWTRQDVNFSHYNIPKQGSSSQQQGSSPPQQGSSSQQQGSSSSQTTTPQQWPTYEKDSQWGLLVMAELNAFGVYVQDGDLPDTRFSPALSALTVALATDVTEVHLFAKSCDVPRIAIIGLSNTKQSVTIQLSKYVLNDFTTQRDGGDLILNHKNNNHSIRFTDALVHNNERRVSVLFSDGQSVSFLTLLTQ